MSRGSRSTSSREKAHLEIPVTQARAELGAMVEEGRGLFREAQNVHLVAQPRDLDDLKVRVRFWHDSSSRWLSQRFSSNAHSTIFEMKRPVEVRDYLGRGVDPYRDRARLSDSLQDRVNYVSGLLNNLHLYIPLPEPASQRQPATAVASRITLNIEHLGQLITDTNTVNNIQTHISGVSTHGDRQVADLLTELVNGLDDPELPAERRTQLAHVLKSLAAEADAPPEKRDRGRIMAFLVAIPAIADGASRFLDLWNQAQPYLTQYFGH